MSNSKQEVYKNYILEKFMNAPSNKHLEDTEDTLKQDDNSKSDEKNMQELFSKETLQENEDVTFTYLENDTLSNNIEYERDYYKDYKMHLCLYKVDTSLRLPFLKYLMKKDQQYVFPNKPIEMKPMIDSVSRNTEEPVDSLFMQQIQKLYQDFTLLELDKIKYKGYIENDSGDIFVFIDISYINISYSEECEFVIIDEILNRGIVRNTNIDKTIVDLFKNNVFLQTIRTEQIIKVQFPKIGYIISQDESGNYKNLIKKDKQQEILLYPKIDHKTYNKVFLFSAIPLSVENIDNLFRFICFVENFDHLSPADNHVYEENDIQYYALKSKDLFKEI